MELTEGADLYSKQVAKESSSLGQKQKTIEKGNKKGWRVAVLVPPRDIFPH